MSEIAMARPQKQISVEQVKKLAAIGCSYAEIGEIVGCDSSTLTRRFAQAIKDGHTAMRKSLRRKQYEVAMDGSTGMLIWLGKQHLSQTDKAEFSGTVKHEHFDLSTISDADLSKIASLVESATASTVGSEK